MESHENHSDALFKFIPVLKNLLTKFYKAYDHLVKKMKWGLVYQVLKVAYISCSAGYGGSN